MINLLISYRGTIYPWQCDHMGHMNVMWYTGKFDEASWYLLSQVGLSKSFLQKQNRGCVAVQQDISYKRELRAGDVVTIRSGILEVREKSMQFFHEMRNEETNEVSAHSIITGVFIDAVERRACPMPHEILENINALKLDDSKLYWEETLTPYVTPNFI